MKYTLRRYFTVPAVIIALSALLFYFNYRLYGWIVLVVASFIAGTQAERAYRDISQGEL